MLLYHTYLEETVTLLEEEVIINELLLSFLGHAGQGVVSSLQFSGQVGKGGRNLVFHLLVLGFGQARVEWVSLQGTTASNTSGNHIFAFRINVDESVSVTEVAGRVFVRLLEATMVVLNDGVEEVSEGGVRFGIRSIDTASRVQVLNTYEIVTRTL
jgi:hypothetical protein